MDNRLPSLEGTYRSKERIKHETKGQRRGKKNPQRNHPRDGSLSISNPARALDTFSGYHGKRVRTQAQ